ncbi:MULTISPECIES: glycosyltransferase family 2 protein [unclassified Microbacterium]|uniref:glycosyltransferase family 2 protein n=1 Tax=unclassified Microbacterium TaxID=2609290 RepID=UPI00214B5EDF|nr:MULTISPECIES: glycosyltransferase family 2 protein [unclassified Microbacterium]MCR2784498.1 glycosyltransferase family 2 protein [Microbacterium sp. zg.B96]MDL5350593.1 glycosyltransferase family 2 protein [Microbacterium sp. zg-YB36]WIM14690.1 glycosyltransferase family 2 protein [Microbacterium sp. zg-B96]
MLDDAPHSGKDAPVVPATAGVTFVMPVLNERDYLERAVRTVLQQDVAGRPVELVLALGPSTDGSNQLAARLAAEDSRIVLVENPAADIPVGLNLAIRAGRYPTIVRVDAHSELTPGYTIEALKTLDRVRAANVGGIMRADGRTPFQRAVARAYNSPIGLGGGAYHSGGAEGPAESAYLGVMRRAVLEEVGMFDESIRRGEDWELNLRIRRAGYRVWFDPELAVTYWPRESWKRLVRQFYATGKWRGELVRRYGRRNSLRYFAPPALVGLALLAVVIAVLQLTGVIAGPWSLAASVVYLPIAAYAVLITAVALGPGGGTGWRDKLWTAAVLPSMHLSWGTGFISGVLRGAHDTVDTSRLGSRNTPLP